MDAAVARECLRHGVRIKAFLARGAHSRVYEGVVGPRLTASAALLVRRRGQACEAAQALWKARLLLSKSQSADQATSRHRSLPALTLVIRI